MGFTKVSPIRLTDPYFEQLSFHKYVPSVPFRISRCCLTRTRSLPMFIQSSSVPFTVIFSQSPSIPRDYFLPSVALLFCRHEMFYYKGRLDGPNSSSFPPRAFSPLKSLLVLHFLSPLVFCRGTNNVLLLTVMSVYSVPLPASVSVFSPLPLALSFFLFV